MMHLPTAKVLLFIALALHPESAQTIYATSNSESYVWTSEANGWNVEAKSFPASDFTRDPSVETAIGNAPTRDDVPNFLRSILKHDWSRDSVMVFDNGDRVEKSGDHAFYIIGAGAPNQQIFTIFFPTDD